MKRSELMKRWIVCMSVAAICAGCSWNSSFTLNPFAHKKGPEPEELPAAQWRELQLENARRTSGEGIPPDAATTQSATTRPANEFEEFVGFVKFLTWYGPKQLINFYLGNTPGKY